LQNAETEVVEGGVGQLQKICDQSSDGEFEYFKQNLLRPFLIKRVPDTEGNRKVQQASSIVLFVFNSYSF